MTKDETITILTTIAAVYQNFDVNQIKKDVWHELIKDVDYRHATTALIKTMKESKFPPTPADIIERAGVEKFVDEAERRLAIEGNGNPGTIGTNQRCLPADKR